MLFRSKAWRSLHPGPLSMTPPQNLGRLGAGVFPMQNLLPLGGYLWRREDTGANAAALPSSVETTSPSIDKESTSPWARGWDSLQYKDKGLSVSTQYKVDATSHTWQWPPHVGRSSEPPRNALGRTPGQCAPNAGANETWYPEAPSIPSATKAVRRHTPVLWV